MRIVQFPFRNAGVVCFVTSLEPRETTVKNTNIHTPWGVDIFNPKKWEMRQGVPGAAVQTITQTVTLWQRFEIRLQYSHLFSGLLWRNDKKSEWSNQSERMIAYCIIYRSIQTSIKNRHQLADVYPTLSDCFTTKLDCTPTIEFSPICWTESILADNKRPGFFLTFITQKIKQGFFLLRYAFLIRRQFKFSICVRQF